MVPSARTVFESESTLALEVADCLVAIAQRLDKPIDAILIALAGKRASEFSTNDTPRMITSQIFHPHRSFEAIVQRYGVSSDGEATWVADHDLDIPAARNARMLTWCRRPATERCRKCAAASCELVHQRLLLVRGGRSPAVFSDRQACHSLEYQGRGLLSRRPLSAGDHCRLASAKSARALSSTSETATARGHPESVRARERIGRFVG